MRRLVHMPAHLLVPSAHLLVPSAQQLALS
jgi:hypothetical protein